ncbi:helix-turn-helix transcriptional regulator [Lactobacillus crispatus]|uniref:helix-turn-helix domain-containing protein n=1 Tax=Lactobacillus crispatus TaxID=47770 RepID=UPI003F249F85
MSVFSERLEQERKRAGWTKTYTAKMLKLPLTTYANYEYGSREPDINTITAISNLFNTSTDYLMGKTDQHNSSTDGKDSDTALTWTDLGMPYGGKIPEDLKQTYADLAKSYFKRHPEMLNDK